MNFKVEALEKVVAPGKFSSAWKAIKDFAHGFADGFFG